MPRLSMSRKSRCARFCQARCRFRPRRKVVPGCGNDYSIPRLDVYLPVLARTPIPRCDAPPARTRQLVNPHDLCRQSDLSTCQKRRGESSKVCICVRKTGVWMDLRFRLGEGVMRERKILCQDVTDQGRICRGRPKWTGTRSIRLWGIL